MIQKSESIRLIIRKFNLNDAKFILRLLNDKSFIKGIGDKKIKSIDDAMTYLTKGPIESYEKNGFGLYMVQLKESNEPIGMCGLLKRDELEFPDLGYAFLPDFFGKGYAYESAKLILREAIDNGVARNISAVTFPDNIRSNRLLQKLGFDFVRCIKLYGKENNLYEFQA